MSSFHRDEKKRCGFIMFVIESAAAGCGIPNYSLERLFRWIKVGQTCTIKKDRHYNCALGHLASQNRRLVPLGMLQSLTFASNYIRIRAFHNAISRSCILLLFNTNRKKMIKNCNTYTKLRIILLSLSFYANFSNKMHSFLTF